MWPELQFPSLNIISITDVWIILLLLINIFYLNSRHIRQIEKIIIINAAITGGSFDCSNQSIIKAILSIIGALCDIRNIYSLLTQTKKWSHQLECFSRTELVSYSCCQEKIPHKIKIGISRIMTIKLRQGSTEQWPNQAQQQGESLPWRAQRRRRCEDQSSWLTLYIHVLR